jgi:hypothetical protein
MVVAFVDFYGYFAVATLGGVGGFLRTANATAGFCSSFDLMNGPD